MAEDTVVLVPTYNERENIKVLIPEIFEVDPTLSVLVIDDNSPDGTRDEVETLMRRYPNLQLLSRTKKEGLGAAYQEAIAQVLREPRFKKVVTMDADGSHAAEYLPDLLRAADTRGLVIGSRYVHGGGIEDWERWRYALSKWGNRYARWVTRLPAHDLTAGYMCFQSSLLRQMDLHQAQASGYAFLMELKFRALRTLHCTYVEIPILFRVRRGGESKISSHIVSEGLMTPWKLRLRKI